MVLGAYNDLIIGRISKIGLFLRDERDEEVLLPTRYVPETYNIGDRIRVFVYNDSEGRPIATTLESKATVNSFATLTCKESNDVGAFLDLGIMKDLFVPKKNQLEPMVTGQPYLVWVYEDKLTRRLVGNARLERELSDRPIDLEPGMEVKILVWTKVDAGWRVVVNNEYVGMVYDNQLFQALAVGDHLNAFVNQIRDDGKIDVLLQRPGHKNIDESADQLVDALEKNNGWLSLTDKSDPETIKKTLGMSKKSFKKAVGTLYKQRIINIERDGIRIR